MGRGGGQERGPRKMGRARVAGWAASPEEEGCGPQNPHTEPCHVRTEIRFITSCVSRVSESLNDAVIYTDADRRSGTLRLTSSNNAAELCTRELKAPKICEQDTRADARTHALTPVDTEQCSDTVWPEPATALPRRLCVITQTGGRGTAGLRNSCQDPPPAPTQTFPLPLAEFHHP
ncbi:unnamed protein product [Rangifer tarandus platyrhynchus]|uniref:Uncharacterized protein n=2 Tax=Rangifer tarandus platyrhynchus TaxID=3082113 RepID=A0ABN8YXJ5_RANTA|nr:unnamed protein product [Rangifer tarandus platyrhynchus]CAI9702057.1 unnamed protein product [Rangifer tarandus platyrhynchus]